LIVPSQSGSTMNLLVTAGKDGQIFLLDRNNLGGYVPPLLASDGYNFSPNAFQKFLIRPGAHVNTSENLGNPGLWGGPAYYDGPLGPTIFYAMNGTQTGDMPFNTPPELVGYFLKNNILVQPATLQSPDTFQNGGSIPVVSSNQKNPNTGILWVVQRGPGNLSLCAYDATNLNSQLPGFPKQLGSWPGLAFIEPTVINGKVYVASSDQITAHVSVFY
jgi:hypothetical protein